MTADLQARSSSTKPRQPAPKTGVIASRSGRGASHFLKEAETRRKGVTDLLGDVIRTPSLSTGEQDVISRLEAAMKDLGYNKDYRWQAGYIPKQGFLPSELSESDIFSD